MLLDDPEVAANIDSAYAAVAARWGQPYERRGDEQPCEAARRGGLDCIIRQGTWNVVRRFDLPVVLGITSASGALRFLGVTSVDERRATVQIGARREVVSVDDIEREWDGGFVVLWRPPRIGMSRITRTASAADIAWLRARLGARVGAFQRAHGLLPDGIAGEETLARLTTVLDPAAPSLRRSRSAS